MVFSIHVHVGLTLIAALLDYWRGLTGDSPSKNDRMLFYESIYDVHSKNKYRLSYVYRGRGRPRKNSAPTIARELHYNKDISDILDMSKTFPVLSPTRLPEREIAIHDEVRSVQDRDQVCCSSCDSEGMHSLKETSKALIAPATLSKLCGLQADVSDGDAEMFLTSLLDIFPEEFNRNEQIIHLGDHCHGNFLQFPPNTGTTKDAEYKRRSAISEVKYCAGHDLSTQSIPLPMHAQSISNSKPEARQSDGRRRKAGEHARKVLMSWVLEHQGTIYVASSSVL